MLATTQRPLPDSPGADWKERRVNCLRLLAPHSGDRWRLTRGLMASAGAAWWCGRARHGMARLGMARPGTARGPNGPRMVVVNRQGSTGRSNLDA